MSLFWQPEKDLDYGPHCFITFLSLLILGLSLIVIFSGEPVKENCHCHEVEIPKVVIP